MFIMNIVELIMNVVMCDDCIGILIDVVVLIEGEWIVWVGFVVDVLIVDEVVDVVGCVLILGFVDSYSYFVFGGDCVVEFEVCMVGQKYVVGGICFMVVVICVVIDDELCM